MKKIVTEEEKSKIIKLYNQGLSLRTIEKTFNISRNHIKQILEDNNIIIRHNGYLKEKKININEYSKIVSLYEGGLYATDIAKQYNVSSSTILNILKSLGVDIVKFTRRSKFSEEDVNNMCKLYDDGNTLKVISELYEVNESEISFLFNKIEKKRRDNSHSKRKYIINENYFDVVDTQEKAYILGILYADGNNTTKTHKIIISLQERDKHILEDILREMDSNIELKFCNKKCEGYQNQYRLVICNKHMSDTLNNLGMVDNKSLILKFPEWLDESLYPHFIRGYFDGDGWISTQKGNYGTSIVGTNSFCQKVKQILDSLDIMSKIYNTYNKSTSIRELKIGKKQDSKIFLDYIYKNATIYLNRKYDVYKKNFCN